MRTLLALCGLLAPLLLHAADVKLPSLFSDHMVLQCAMPVPVWGTAMPGEKITVTFAGQTKTVTADAAGKWLLRLDPLQASASPRELLIDSLPSHKTLRVADVLVGEVWLCGGQSNMERQLGPRPPQPLIQNWEQEVASANFPLIPFAIKGAIWFQGESGPGLPVAYDALFQRMITDWRAHWGEGDFPFLFVQLPNGSPLTREAQARALALPNTGMAVGIDVGDKDVHGPIKAPLGDRLARLALTKAYGCAGDAVCPMFKSATVDGRAMRVTFSHAAGGLMAKEPLQHFTVAGADKHFVPAEARIDGEGGVVSSPAVSSPVSVRYAWSTVAAGGNLFNKAGLPAAPFRTDDWQQ